MKILAITQARYGSTRLPAKILKTVNETTLLEIHLRRLLQSKRITKLKIATTDEEGSKYIIDIANKVGVEYCQGSVDDVLSRFIKTADGENPDYIVRVTSDCPLIDPNFVDQAIGLCVDGGYDYVSIDGKSFPDGMDCEVFKYAALLKADQEATLQSEREHVTPYIWKNGTVRGGSIFKSERVYHQEDWSKFRITVDTPEDFSLVEHLIQRLGYDKSCDDYVAYLQQHPEVMAMNDMYERNEGYAKSINQDKKV
jgi:spore coat polysaccharide biosynthesis protein SpsF (cytidylyltransferase family)